MDIEEKLLKLIKSNKKGILQNELWKKAKIDSSKCSRIVARLEKEGIIKRETAEKGSKTYRIKYIPEKKIKTKNFNLLLIGDMFSPCTGCMIECTPEHCVPLSEWVYGLEEKE